MSHGDDLSHHSKDFDPSQPPHADTAVCLLEDPHTLSSSSSELSPGDVKDLWLQDTIHLDDIKLCADFVKHLQCMTLSDSSLGLSAEAVECLCNPLCTQSPLSITTDLWLAIDLYLVNPSEATYKANWVAFLRCSLHLDLPSHYRTTHLVSEITGIESVVHHMCINLCIAYTGPFLDLEACPLCLEPQYCHAPIP